MGSTSAFGIASKELERNSVTLKHIQILKSLPGKPLSRFSDPGNNGLKMQKLQKKHTQAAHNADLKKQVSASKQALSLKKDF